MTHNADNAPTRATVFYDADCALCRRLVARHGPVFERRGFLFEPLQRAIRSGHHPIPAAEFQREMKLLTADRRWLGGADAWLELWASVGWMRPLAMLGRLPGLHALAVWIYGHIAANRHCLDGACRIGPRPAWDRWLPLILMPVLVLVFFRDIEPWLFMWLLAGSLFAGCKWLTLRDAMTGSSRPHWRVITAYLFLWPGMNARQFLFERSAARPRTAEWLAAAGKTLAGVGIVGWAVSMWPPDQFLPRGWTGMIGIVLLLHFGAFHLLSLIWRQRGLQAPPIMDAPLKARSLTDFWGRRWNRAFHELTADYLFQPLSRWMNRRVVLLLAFFVSGLIHELVITVPAGGGHGLPTLYFLAQGAGLIVERARWIRRRPLLNRLFAWMVLILPVGCLFPRPFVEQVILPMLSAIGIQ